MHDVIISKTNKIITHHNSDNMITAEVIDTLYKKYRKLPKSPDCLDMPLLFDNIGELHKIVIDPDTEEVVIGSIDQQSPFHRLPLRHVNAIVPFDEWVALVLHSSIVFLNKKSSKVSVHVKPYNPTVWERVKWMFSGSMR